jgi:hypothetical protein
MSERLEDALVNLFELRFPERPPTDLGLPNKPQRTSG